MRGLLFTRSKSTTQSGSVSQETWEWNYSEHGVLLRDFPSRFSLVLASLDFAMSIRPLWPDLRPRSTDPLWFNADRPCDDESEVAALEAEHQAWRDHVRVQGYEHIPIGKTVSDFRGSEGEEEEEEEEEGEGEEEDESDTHEEEEEELDEIDMEVSYSHHPQRSSPTDTVTAPVSIRMVNASNLTRYS